MPAPEFSERQYEFCANYQLQRAVGAYLVGGMPAIPSQLEEALRGYDAAYRFVGGRVLFVQYKAAHFAPKAWGRGAPTFQLWNAPYYRAQLHQDRLGRYTQHNTLIGLTSSSAEALYVSPCFYERAQLLARFAGGTGTRVLDDSILAPLSVLRRIHDAEPHSITYSQYGSAFRLHSEPTGPYDAAPTLARLLDRVEETRWGGSFFASVRDELRETLLAQNVASPDRPAEGFDGPLAEIAALLDERVGAVMALVPSGRGAAP
jgi:hypothetical protein